MSVCLQIDCMRHSSEIKLQSGYYSQSLWEDWWGPGQIQKYELYEGGLGVCPEEMLHVLWSVFWGLLRHAHSTYHKISNNSYTLLIFTTPLSSKRCKLLYSNLFVRVKLFYCSYSKNANTVRWHFWRSEVWVNMHVLFAHGVDPTARDTVKPGFQPQSLASYTLCSVMWDKYLSMFYHYASLVSPALQDIKQML